MMCAFVSADEVLIELGVNVLLEVKEVRDCGPFFQIIPERGGDQCLPSLVDRCLGRL